MYLRFIAPTTNRESEVRDGLFAAAWRLRQDPALPAADEGLLRDLMTWFGSNMRMPDRFNRTKSKGHYRRAAKGLSWFKDTATDHIARMRQIAEILERHGIHTETVHTDRPGYIVYEDEHQIVAEPFNDTPVG